MIVRFFSWFVVWALSVLVILGLFICAGCGSAKQDTSTGKLRELESKQVINIHDARYFQVMGVWNAKRLAIYQKWDRKRYNAFRAWADDKISLESMRSIHNDIRYDRDRDYERIMQDRDNALALIRHDRKYASK